MAPGHAPLLKLHVWPDSPSSSHWRSEVRTWLIDAADRSTPSMRQRVDLGELYLKALYLVRAEVDASIGTRPLPEACLFTLDELLSVEPDVEALLLKLESAVEIPSGC